MDGNGCAYAFVAGARGCDACFDEKGVVGILPQEVCRLLGGLLEVIGSAPWVAELEEEGDIASWIDVPMGQSGADASYRILRCPPFPGGGMAGVEDTLPGQEGAVPVTLEFQFGGQAQEVAGPLGRMLGILGESRCTLKVSQVKVGLFGGWRGGLGGYWRYRL